MNLLNRVTSFENLEKAFIECSRRKKKYSGYQNILIQKGEKLLDLQGKIRSEKYQWGHYREFYVCDPKRRLVMAAPFIDRVVHHAIHRVIEPVLDKHLSDCVLACRHGRGNRSAVQLLKNHLKIIGSDRYTLKLDIKQYFPSINHLVLLQLLKKYLPDQSLNPLLESLLKSHKGFSERGCGIPIGNLTSQLFANFYISEIDQMACDMLGAPYFWNEPAELNPESFYIRYMDDLILISKNKKTVCAAAEKIIGYAQTTLKLEIPVYKRMHLQKADIPFLGFLVGNECRPLARNKRRIRRKIFRIQRNIKNQHGGYKPSDLEMVIGSYRAWRTI